MILTGVQHATDSITCPCCGTALDLDTAECPECGAQIVIIRRRRKKEHRSDDADQTDVFSTN